MKGRFDTLLQFNGYELCDNKRTHANIGAQNYQTKIILLFFSGFGRFCFFVKNEGKNLIREKHFLSNFFMSSS